SVPPKPTWALPIDGPPYHGFVVTCGITFTFGGLRINADGEVLDTTDATIPGLYAAGELVGGIFYQNYLGGAGLMSGSVFGRLAGRSAGPHAMRPAPAAAEWGDDRRQRQSLSHHPPVGARDTRTPAPRR